MTNQFSTDYLTRLHMLGFTTNPFRTLSDHEWASIAFIPHDIQRIIDDSGLHIQLLGKKGRGKSTILRGLQQQLTYSRHHTIYEHIPVGHHRFLNQFDEENYPDVFLLDEVQRLWPWEHWRLLQAVSRYNIRLMISSHLNVSLGFRLCRFKVKTFHVDALSIEDTKTLLNKRIDLFRINNRPEVYFTRDAIEYLDIKFDTNRRAMERFLYLVFQSITEPTPINQQILESVEQQI